jgi:hypothetical protein
MNRYRSMMVLGLVLVLSSLVIYVIHYLLFSDLKDLAFYTLMDIAFVPIQVLLVGIIIENIIAEREKGERVQKLNMVVGAFFSEVGRPLATVFLNATPSRDEIISKLHVSGNWGAKEYNSARLYIEKNSSISFEKIDLEHLRSFMIARRNFMLRLIENPNLLEHEKFTDLLLSSFHLLEELESRPVLDHLPHNDLAHIRADILRAFQNLAIEWLDYMQHLKANYPFLFSHYLRISPYQLKPSAIIE